MTQSLQVSGTTRSRASRSIEVALAALALFSLGAGGGALAQTAMPPGHPSAMPGQGQALYEERMPQGTATVKVVGSSITDAKVGQLVELYEGKDGAPQKIGEAKTADNGRASFEGLSGSSTYIAVVALPDGRKLQSAPFQGPNRGGVRLLISLEGSAGHGGQPATTGSHEGHDHEGHDHAGHDHQAHAQDGSGDPNRSGAGRLAKLPDTPDGTVQVEVVLGKAAKGVAGVPVEVTRGTDKSSHRTNAQGRVELKPEGKQQIKISVAYGGHGYSSGLLAPPESGGVRISFTVYDRTSDPSVLRFGGGSHLLGNLGEERIGFRQVLNLVNTSEKLFDPGPGGMPLPVPEGAVGLDLLDADKRFLKVAGGSSVRLTAPLPPGTLSIQYFFELRYQGSSLDFRQQLPAQMDRSVFAITNTADVNITGPSVEARRVETMARGKAAVFTLRPVQAGQYVDFTLTELPSHDRRPLYATLSLAGLIMLWGLVAAARGGAAASPAGRREALLEEIVQLERRHRDGGLDEKAYRQQRKKLTGELRGIWEQDRF